MHHVCHFMLCDSVSGSCMANNTWLILRADAEDLGAGNPLLLHIDGQVSEHKWTTHLRALQIFPLVLAWCIISHKVQGLS